MRREFNRVDAFTDQPFGGNGCAAAHGGAVLSDAVCMARVRERSLVECAFAGAAHVVPLLCNMGRLVHQAAFLGSRGAIADERIGAQPTVIMSGDVFLPEQGH